MHKGENVLKKILFAAPLAAALFLFHAAPSQAMTLRISAPKIELELAPGETYSGEIVAENPTDEAVNVKAYLEDWQYTANATGEKKFSPAGSTPSTASPWITFAPAVETIQPYGRITARYTVTVPKDVQGAHFSVLFFETLLGSSKDEEGVNVLVAGRIGALFFVRVKGTAKRDGAVKSVDVQAPSGSKPMEITTTFQNTGNVDVTLGGNFLIMGSDGRVLGRGDLAKIYTFPGGEGTRVTQWIGKLPSGTYDLLITYDLGQGKTIVEEKTLTVP